MADRSAYQHDYYLAHRGAAAVRQHGQRRTPEYEAWANAKRRTTNPNHPSWPHYGGRGIAMCAEWLDSFPAFLAHIGPRPEGTTLDRINNDGDYEPGNVRWVTMTEQARNRRARGRK